MAEEFGYCGTCKKMIPLTNIFFARNSRSVTGYQNVCKKCDNYRRSIKWKDRSYHHVHQSCKLCDVIFIASRAQINKGWSKFCSKECFEVSMK